MMHVKSGEDKLAHGGERQLAFIACAGRLYPAIPILSQAIQVGRRLLLNRSDLQGSSAK